jgi:hypothetical protein
MGSHARRYENKDQQLIDEELLSLIVCIINVEQSNINIYDHMLLYLDRIFFYQQC